MDSRTKMMFMLVVCMCLLSSSGVAAALILGGEKNSVVATKAAIPVPVIKKYRYVRIYRDLPAVVDAGGHWMNPAEVEVFSGGVNVAAGKTVTGSSLYSGKFPHSNLVDGNKKNFESVVITNRTQCCQARMENTKIQLSKTSDMTTSEDSKVITKAEAVSASFTWTVASNTIVAA